MIRRAVLAAAAFLLTAFAVAHPDHGETMADIDRILAINPKDATRLLWRAELHRLDGDFPSALADVAAAEEIDATTPVANLTRGRVLLDSREPSLAVVALRDYITSVPDGPEGHLLLARALDQSGDFAAADSQYARALTVIVAPRADDYLEWARLRAANSRTSGAIEILDAGIARVGLAPGLVLEAVDIETSAGQVDAALTRIDGLAARFPRRGAWNARKAQILERAGRKADAVAMWRAVLAELDTLPPQRRDAPDARALTNDAQAAIARLEGAL